MKKYFLIILFFQAFNLFASVPLKKGDAVNVWSTDGLALYQQPDLKSKKLTSIPYGTSLNITDAAVKAQPVTVSLKIGDSKQALQLKGNWVKIRYNNQEGYVFSGYLSKLACFKIKPSAEPDENYMERNYGKPKITIKKVKTATITTRTYKNGIVQAESVNDGCTGTQLYFKGISYQDVLLYTNASLLGADAANNIRISDLKNGKFELSYDACD